MQHQIGDLHPRCSNALAIAAGSWHQSIMQQPSATTEHGGHLGQLDESPDSCTPAENDALKSSSTRTAIRPLEGMRDIRSTAPDWYRDAMAVPVEKLFIDVERARIELLCWGNRGNPGILLIHGASAHSRWWGPVAPLLAKDYRVAAFSWSGTGGSDWRDSYSVRQTAREAWAAAEAAGLIDAPRKPVVIGHSFGGKAAALLAASHGDAMAGTIFIDSFLSSSETLLKIPNHRRRIYTSEAEALDRFRFRPDQPATNLFIVEDIARASLRQVDGGWRWHFDPDFFQKLAFANGWRELSEARCPLAFLRGELSRVVSVEDVDAQRAQTPPGTIFVDIAEAHHHIMVDQPLAMVATLRALVEAWAAYGGG
jgi:pimeloyl-ACP methyl ester carboxylesterase